MVIRLVSSRSPWSFIEISPFGSRWLVPQHSGSEDDLAPHDILDMGAVEDELRLKVRRAGSMTPEDVVVKLPGGSLPVDTQADLALWAFLEQQRSAAEEKAEP